MSIRRKILSVMLSAAMILSLIPATVVKADPEKEMYTRNIEVTVLAYSTEEKMDVPVEGAVVTLENGKTVLAEAVSDAEGIAVIPLEGIAAEDLPDADVHAYKVVDRVPGPFAAGREEVYNHFPKDDNGNMYRFEYRICSEEIDSNGTWRGRKLPFSTSNQADIVFVVDGTGSMEDDLENVRENVKNYLDALKDLDFDFRFSVIEYRDYFNGEKPKIYEENGTHWFTDKDTVAGFLSLIEADGGGDAYAETLGDTLDWFILDPEEMDYRNDASRFIFCITDADNQFEVRGGAGFDQSKINEELKELCINASVISLPELEAEYESLYENTGGSFFDISSSGFSNGMFELTRDTLCGETAKVELTLSEPRMLVNVSVCYLADDDDSRSESYQADMKEVMNQYSQLMAQATDGHVYVGSVILYSADSLMDFFTLSDRACMADIQFHTTTSDTESIRANAMSNGMYSTDRNYGSGVNLSYFDPPDETQYRNRDVYSRIQIGATKDSKDIHTDPQYMAATIMHESGHYIFGFFDEYMDSDKKMWSETGKNNKPYYCFGLMDDQHFDIEISKRYIDYSYVDPYSKEPQTFTYQYNVYSDACEDVLADLLTKGLTYADTGNIRNSFYTAHTEPLFTNPYLVYYTYAGYSLNSLDRTVEYPYAALNDSSFIILDADGNETAGAPDPGTSWISDIIDEIAPGAADFGGFDEKDFYEQSESLAGFGKAMNENTVPVSIPAEEALKYHVLVKKTGESGYTEIEIKEEDGNFTADLPVGSGDLAEVVIVKEEDGKAVYNQLHIDRSEPAEGYMYSSADGKVLAYGNTGGEATFTFVTDNSSYKEGDFFSVNQATHVFTDGKEMTGGEIYSIVPCTEDVDFSSISWFKFDGEKWVEIPTEITSDENMNVGAKADLSGEGLYVLMAKASANEPAEAPQALIYERSASVDGRVRILFDDLNENSRYYYVYYSKNLDDDPDWDEMPMEIYEADKCEFLSETERALTLNLRERDETFVVYVETILDDGSRSGLASVYVMTGAADRDGDGIPDWFMDKYGLWSAEHPELVAGNDADGDGWTNWQEYRRGTNPLVPDGQLQLSKRPRG